jgi:hypothetical protein
LLGDGGAELVVALAAEVDGQVLLQLAAGVGEEVKRGEPLHAVRVSDGRPGLAQAGG